MSTTAKTTAITKRRVDLRLPGLGRFVRLDSSAGARRFKKDVLRLGKFVLPDGSVLDVTPDLMEGAAKHTNRWIREGQKVWFPEDHTAKATANLGYWTPDFQVEGDRLFGIVEVLDEGASEKVGRTIQDVSAGIRWDEQSSSGEVFPVVIEHVCATSNPVVTGQGNFVQLAREVNMADDGKKDGEGSSLTLSDKIKVLLGLPDGADDDAIFNAVRSCYLDEEPDQDDQQGGEGAAVGLPAASEAYMSKELKKVRDELEGKYGKQLADLRRKSAEREVELARESSMIPIDEDTRKDALALLARGDEDGERLGRKLLELAKAPKPINGQLVSNPLAKTQTDKTRDLDRDATRAEMLRAAGYRVDLDKEGRIERTTPPADPRTASTRRS